MKKLAAFSFLALSITLQTIPCLNLHTSLNVSSNEIARIERPESRTLYSFPSQGGSTTAQVGSGASEAEQLEFKKKEISTLQKIMKEQKKWDALKGAVIGSAVGTAATALVFLLASK